MIDTKYDKLFYTSSSMSDNAISSTSSANLSRGPVVREVKESKTLEDLALEKATRNLEEFHFGEYVAPNSPAYAEGEITHPMSPTVGTGKRPKFEYDGDFHGGRTSPTEVMDAMNFPFPTDGKYFTVTAKAPAKIVDDRTPVLLFPEVKSTIPSAPDQERLVSAFQQLTVVPQVAFEHKHAPVPEGGSLPVPHQINQPLPVEEIKLPLPPVVPIPRPGPEAHVPMDIGGLPPGPVNLIAVNEAAGDYSNLNFQFVSRRYPPGRNENIGWAHWILEKFGVDIYVRVTSAYSYAVAARGEDLRSSFASTTRLDHKDPLYAVVQYSETIGFDILGLKFFLPWTNFTRPVVVSYEAFTQLSQGPSFAIGMEDGTAFLAAARSDRCTNNINLNRYSSTSIKHWTSILAFKRFSSVLSEFNDITLPSVPLNLDAINMATTSPRLMGQSSTGREKMLSFALRAVKILVGLQLGYLLVANVLEPLGHNLAQLTLSILQQALQVAADATCPQSIKYCYRGLKYLWGAGSALISRP